MGLVTLLGSNTAFLAVFGVFLAAFFVLAVVTLRWAVRRDRAGRAEWLRRRTQAEGGGPTGDDARSTQRERSTQNALSTRRRRDPRAPRPGSTG